MGKSRNKQNSVTALLHPNYKDAKHAPKWLAKYEQKATKPCKWCGSDPKDIVVYDMPLKDGRTCKVWRCTVCDNLIRVNNARKVKESVNGGKGVVTRSYTTL